jgi:hypothetical protein
VSLGSLSAELGPGSTPDGASYADGLTALDAYKCDHLGLQSIVNALKTPTWPEARLPFQAYRNSVWATNPVNVTTVE